LKSRVLKVLAISAFGLPLALLSTTASAIPIVGTSGGSFSSLSSCDSSGWSQNCRIVSSANGSSTQVQWGSQSSWFDFVAPSTLTAVDLNINADTSSGLGVAIARVDWYNSPTIATTDLNTLAVRLLLTLNFTSPSGPDGNGSEVFDLSIINPVNPPGDLVHGFNLADLTAWSASFSLSNVLMSNFRYSVVDGAGAGNSYYRDGVWYNDESNLSSLYVLADFRAAGPPSSVPEPATLALLGAGLLGVACFRRRAARYTA
jgi:hypothetical protein